MLHTLSPRLVFFGLSLTALVAMLFARIYLQEILGLDPCPLCMTQRVFVVLWGGIALLAALHNPAITGRRIYAALCSLAAIGGGAVAVRHVWLQHLPPDQVPACGPSLEYMLESFPFSETLKRLVMGDGNCAEVVWSFLGLSMGEWSLLWFIGFFIASITYIFREE